jgi:membrane protein
MPPRPSPARQLATESVKAALKDDISGRSAQLAYYFFLSLFPGLIFFSSALGLIARHGSHLEDQLLHAMAAVLPETSFGMVRDIFAQITKGSGGGKFTFGILFALWSATAGMSAVQDTLNAVHEVEEGRPFWKRSLNAVGLTLGAFILGIVALAFFFFGNSIIGALGTHSGFSTVASIAWRILSWALALFLFSLVFALTYYWAPDVEQPKWQWITPGAIIGILAWIIASLGFRLYLHYFDSYSKTYGSMGAVIVLLLWFYVSGFALLFGAELNTAVENRKAKEGDPSAKEKGEKAPA